MTPGPEEEPLPEHPPVEAEWWNKLVVPKKEKVVIPPISNPEDN